MLRWIKTGKTAGEEGTTITYQAVGRPSLTIESRKRHIPHANGSGTWDHTSYFVLLDGIAVKEKMSLRDAKEFAEEIVHE